MRTSRSSTAKTAKKTISKDALPGADLVLDRALVFRVIRGLVFEFRFGAEDENTVR
jgi:hypothetical protein